MRRPVWILTATALVLAGCGGDGTSRADAREIIVAGLMDTGAMPAEVAACVADEALATHDIDDLVNEAGVTTAAVNASVAEIARACRLSMGASTTTTSTTLPVTTTSSSTTLIAGLDGYCQAVYAVVVALAAGAGPLAGAHADTLDLWFTEAIARTELAAAAAPNVDLQRTPLTLRSTLTEFDLVGTADELTAASEGLTGLLRGPCAAGDDLDTRVATDATALAAALQESAASTTTSTTVPPVRYETITDPITDIAVAVPPTWSQYDSGTDIADRRYVIRTADLASFTAPGVNGNGVRIVGAAGTDYGALLTAFAPPAPCRLALERQYSDSLYVGTIRHYADCGGTSTEVIVLAAADTTLDESAFVEIRLTAPDQSTVDAILNSFYV